MSPSQAAIETLRTELARHGHYAFVPLGGSMWPFLPSGHIVFVEAARAHEARVGDIVLLLRPGRGGGEDQLLCHRKLCSFGFGGRSWIYTKGDNLLHVERLEEGVDAEFLGVVRATSRAWDVEARQPTRLEALAALGVSLFLRPLAQRLRR